MMNKKEYTAISDESRRELEEKLFRSITDESRREKAEENCYKYEVILQDIKFITYMYEEELRLSVSFTIDILEELKEINNSGIDKEVFEQIFRENMNGEKSEPLQMIRIWNKISTNKMAEIFAKIDNVRRVGGAWAMFIANPGLINAIIVVYEKLVDKFEDKEFYDFCGYFLLRAIMRMNSSEDADF